MRFYTLTYSLSGDLALYPLRSAVIFLFAIMLNSCISQSGSNGRVSRLFESFFVGGDAGLQYYIQSLTFSNDQKEKLLLDITFRSTRKSTDSAVVNFSIIGLNAYQTLDSLRILAAGSRVPVAALKQMFCDKTKNGFTSRFTSVASLEKIKSLFKSSDWKIVSYRNGKAVEFGTPAKTRKKITRLDEALLSIL